MGLDQSVQEVKALVLDTEDGDCVIYGAHNMAALVLDYFALSGRANIVSAILVTSKEGNPKRLRNLLVREFSQPTQVAGKIVIIAMPDKFHTEVRQTLSGCDCKQIICFTDRAQFQLFREDAKLCYPQLTQGRYKLEDDPLDWQYMNFFDKSAPLMHFKVAALPDAGFPYTDESKAVLHHFDLLRDSERNLGTYRPVRELSNLETGSKLDFSIYAIQSARDVARPADEEALFVRPIQAGAVQSYKRSCELGDDTGDNISGRNQSMAEMTAIYWLWKHLPISYYIGVCHYRRQFALTEGDYRRIRECNIDAVLTAPRFVLPDVQCCFEHLSRAGDCGQLLAIIKEKQPDYYDDAKTFYEQQLFYPCNMFILKREFWADYGNFVFSVLLAFDEQLRSQGRSLSSRFSAYWGETLTALYFMHHRTKMSIALTELRLQA